MFLHYIWFAKTPELPLEMNQCISYVCDCVYLNLFSHLPLIHFLIIRFVLTVFALASHSVARSLPKLHIIIVKIIASHLNACPKFFALLMANKLLLVLLQLLLLYQIHCSIIFLLNSEEHIVAVGKGTAKLLQLLLCLFFLWHRILYLYNLST